MPVSPWISETNRRATIMWLTLRSVWSSGCSGPGVSSVSMSLSTFLFWSTMSSSLRSLASWSGPIVTGAATGEVAGAPWVTNLWGGEWYGPWNHKQPHLSNTGGYVDTVIRLSLISNNNFNICTNLNACPLLHFIASIFITKWWLITRLEKWVLRIQHFIQIIEFIYICHKRFQINNWTLLLQIK